MKLVNDKIIFLGVFLGLSFGCGKAPSKPFNGAVGEANQEQQVLDPEGNPLPPPGSEAIPMVASLAAFETHVYGPILSQYCSACHAETFAPKASEAGADGVTMVAAPAEMAKAHLAFLSRSNFEAFAGVDQTTPVLKMEYKNGGHNCWEAEPKKCYDKMFEAVKSWLGELETAGYKPKPVQYPNESGAVAFAGVAPITIAVDPASYILGAPDKQPAPAAPWVIKTDDPDGPLKAYAVTEGVAAAGNAAVAAQAMIYNMDIKAAGTYYVWARIKTPAGNMSRFFVGPNGVNGVVQTPGATTDWKWVQMMQGNANNRVPMTFTLAAAPAAPVPVRVFHGDPGAKIGQVVVTNRKDDFNGEQISNQYFDIKVPLKVEGVEGASLIATVWRMTNGEGKKSVGVKELRIESPVPLHVKNIKPLINGLYSSNHATYTIVDTVAGGAGADSVIKTGGSTSSIWVADLEKDTLSFSFETIEAAK